MDILDWLLHPRRALSGHRTERQRAVLARELRTYQRLIDGIAFNPSVSPDTSLPIERCPGVVMAKVEAEFADFRGMCEQAASARDALARRLADPRLDSRVRNDARPRFEHLAKVHPTDMVIAALEALWHDRLERLERIARPAPAARNAHARGPARGVVPFDLQDRLHPGWWHGA